MIPLAMTAATAGWLAWGWTDSADPEESLPWWAVYLGLAAVVIVVVVGGLVLALRAGLLDQGTILARAADSFDGIIATTERIVMSLIPRFGVTS